MIQSLELPKYCGDCIKTLREVIEVGKCKYCGKSLSMKRIDYEKRQKLGEPLVCCEDCIPIMRREKDNKVFRKKECRTCKKIFTITYGDKKFYEKKGWNLPNRCAKCRRNGNN